MTTTASLLARYPNPRSVLGAPMLRGPEGGELYNQVPMLSGFVDGFAGIAPDELGHSVLDPKNEDAKTGAKWGYGISTALNVVPPLAAGLKMLKGSAAAPRIGSNQTGAIRIGGDPGMVLTHAFRDARAPRITHAGQYAGDDGGLVAPSLGVSYKRGNDYNPTAPALIFSADAAEKMTPANYPGITHVNRDGYFSNPVGTKYVPNLGMKVYDPAEHVKELQNAQSEAMSKFGTPDLRLMQLWPGDAHGAAIAASPNFRTMKEFEESALGGGLLKDYEAGNNTNFRIEVAQKLNKMGLSRYGVEDLYRKAIQGGTFTPEEQELWNLAQRVPSKMSELKVPQLLPVGSKSAAVYLPQAETHNFKELSALRDSGFQFTTGEDLRALAQSEGQDLFNSPGRNLPRLAPATGGIWTPPHVPAGKGSFKNPDSFMDFIADTPAEFAHSPKYAGQKSYFDLGGLKVPSIGDMKALPKVSKQPIPWDKDVNLDGLFPELDTSPETTALIQSWGKGLEAPAPKLTLGDDMTLGAPAQFAPAKKGWSKAPALVEHKQPAGAGPTLSQMQEMGKPGYKIPMSGQGSEKDLITHFNLHPDEAAKYVSDYYNEPSLTIGFDEYMIKKILGSHGDDF